MCLRTCSTRPKRKRVYRITGTIFGFMAVASYYNPAAAGSPCNDLQAVKSAEGNTRGDDAMIICAILLPGNPFLRRFPVLTESGKG